MIGTIKSVDVKSAKNGKEYKAIIFTNGKKMSLFSSGFDGKPAQGYDLVVNDATLELETEESGEFTNILSVSPAPEGTKPVPETISQPELLKQTSISGLSAAKSVVQLVCYDSGQTFLAIMGEKPYAEMVNEAARALVSSLQAYNTLYLPTVVESPPVPSQPQIEPVGLAADLARHGLEKKQQEDKIRELLRARGIKGINQLAQFMKNNHFAETSIENLNDDGLLGLQELLTKGKPWGGTEIEPGEILF